MTELAFIVVPLNLKLMEPQADVALVCRDSRELRHSEVQSLQEDQLLIQNESCRKKE